MLVCVMCVLMLCSFAGCGNNTGTANDNLNDATSGENYDGSGYPSGLKKSEIPLLARIIMVADYTDRHLRRGESSQIVIRKLRTLSGYKFDPADARIMENILNESNQ